MRGTKEVLVKDIPGLYAVGSVIVDKERFYAAASENRQGKVFLIHARTKKISEIAGSPGGVMAVLDASQENAMLCIEEFYPVFDSATSKIVKVLLKREGDRCEAVGRVTVAEVPYVHRIAQLKEEDGLFIAAGKLCRWKESPDDWSTSGSMEIAHYDPEAGATEFEQVQGGIWKHHAMFVKKNDAGFDDLYYGGTEGVFRSVRKNGSWETEQLLSVPTSDIVCVDLDGDGKDELTIIEEFHGDQVTVFKDYGNGLERALEMPLSFGHVLWGGDFLGQPGLIAGSRSGEKKLTLYRFGLDSEKKLHITDETTLDEGQAPAQIIVNEEGTAAEVAAANHGAAELVRYQYCSDERK